MPTNEPPVDGDPRGRPAVWQDARRALDALAARAQAIGVLMVELGVSADAAADRLSDDARQAGLTVDTLAHELLTPYAALDDGEPGDSSAVG